MRVFISVISVFLLASCADLNRPKQLERIDAMLTSIDSLSGVCGTFATDSLLEKQNKVLQLNEILSERFVGDTIDIDLAVKLDEFAAMRDDLNYLLKELPTVEKSLSEVRVSLSTLRKDIDAGNGKRDKYDAFITREKKKVQSVTKASTELTNLKNKSVSIYVELFDDLQHLTSKEIKENL